MIGHGLRAGAAGAGALYASDAVEAALVGREAVYTPRAMARRLLGRRPGRLGALAAGGIRIAYGMALGGLYCGARPFLPKGAAAPALALSVAMAERLAFPRLGLVPPVRRWPALERLLLLAHTSVFAAVTEGWLRRAVARRTLADPPLLTLPSGPPRARVSRRGFARC